MVCVSCNRLIDAEAKLCPYCGANPHTGERFDPAPLLEETFSRRRDLPVHESILEVFRRRQSLVITLIITAAVLFGLGLHQWAEMRNQRAVNEIPAVPLSDVADISNQPASEPQLPLPSLDFTFEGNPRTMRTFVVETGAVAPPRPATASAGAPAAVPGTAAAPPAGASAAPATARSSAPANPPPPPR